MARSKIDPAIILARTRELSALEMRKAGKDYFQIADVLGVGDAGARTLVRRAMDRIAVLSNEEAEELRAIDVERINVMLAGLWQAANSGDVAAVATVIKLQERKAKMLGLDKTSEDKSQGNIVLNVIMEAQKDQPAVVTIDASTTSTTMPVREDEGDTE